MFIYNLYTRYIIDFIDVAESFFDQTNEKIVQTENEMVQLKSNKIQCSEPIPCKNANELHRISKRTPLNTHVPNHATPTYHLSHLMALFFQFNVNKYFIPFQISWRNNGNTRQIWSKGRIVCNWDSWQYRWWRRRSIRPRFRIRDYVIY